MKRKDYYKILGVARKADQRSIQRAFRQLARRYHPDTNPSAKNAPDKFREINEAYQILSDPAKRAAYDRQVHAAQPRSQPVRSQSTAHPAAASRPAPNEPEPTGPIHSSQATPSDIFAGATLFIMVFACAFIALGLYQVVKLIAPASAVEQPTLTARQRQTLTRQMEQTQVASVYLPTSTPAPGLLHTTLAPAEWRSVLRQDNSTASINCTIDLARGQHTCQDIAQIVIRSGPHRSGDLAGSVLLEIDLDPRKFPYTRARFAVTYATGVEPHGLTINIGDSKSNEGQGGDAQNRGANAEIVVKDNRLIVYGNRSQPGLPTVLAQAENFVVGGATVVLEISDQRLLWANTQGTEALVSRYLYALGGQGTDSNDYTIYAAFNRAVRIGTAVRGTGVERVEIVLLPALE